MRLTEKHQNQRTITFNDFSGGLNTTSHVDGIAANQLATSLNVEIDHTNNRLKTVAGTVDFLEFSNIFAAIHDEINNLLLVVKNNKRVYAVELADSENRKYVGDLNGDMYPLASSWEDGTLIASGGRLQYFNGKKLETIETAPACTGVYVRAGRVLVTDEHNVRYSAVGDETSWIEDTDDDSSAKFAEIGYKDGGKILRMINLSTDVLFIKDTRRVYRLNGEYPNWSINEVSRNVEIRNRLSVCAIADSVFLLGQNEVQTIQTTTDYGDMKPANVALLISRELQSLPQDTLFRYVPPLNQLWIISGTKVFMFDLITQSWYKRQFNSPVLDVVPIGEEVFIIKPDRVSRLNEWSLTDAGEPLFWYWQGQRLLSANDFFVKRVQVSYTPLDRLNSEGQFRVGDVIVVLPRLDDKTVRKRILSPPGDRIYKNIEPIYHNPKPIYNRITLLSESRNVYRRKALDIKAHGKKGGMIFNEIMITLAEV